MLIDASGHERARHKIPYGALLLADDGATVEKGQKIAEWDPYTIPIISEISGSAVYRDVNEGIAMREILDEATGISNRVIIDCASSRRALTSSRASPCATTRARF